MYRIYRIKLYGPVMINLYKEKYVTIEIRVKVNIILQNLDTW